MNSEITQISGGRLGRRAALATGLGLAGLPLAVAAAPSAPQSADEAANIDFVTRFCVAWSSRDVEQLIPFVAETLEYHVSERGPLVTGHEQLRSQMGPFMTAMQSITWDIKRSSAIGDIVINERSDHFVRKPGSDRPDNHFEITGVFLVRDGKIQYWSDYRMPKAK